MFYVVANEKIAHIAMMKSKEKGKSKKNRRPAGTKKMFFASSVSLRQIADGYHKLKIDLYNGSVIQFRTRSS